MKKIIKRLLCAVITGAMLLSTGAMPAAAANEENEQNVQKTTFSNGYYNIPLTVLCGSSANPNTESETFDKYRSALLTVNDGQYKLTLRIATTINNKNNNEVLKTIKVLKDTYSFNDVALSTEENPDGGLRTGTIQSGCWDDTKFWDDTIITETNETYGYTDVTISMSSLRDSVILAIPQISRGEAIAPQLLYVYSLDYSQADKLPDIQQNGSYQLYWRTGNTFQSTENGMGTDGYQRKFDSSVEELITALIKPEVDVTVSDGEATATFTLTDKGKEASSTVSYVSAYNFSKSFPGNIVPVNDSYYSDADINDGKFQLKYDVSDYKDIAFGRFIKIYGGEKVGKNKTTKLYYFGTINLSKSRPAQKITLQDSDSGIKFESTSDVISEDDQLKVSKGSANDDAFSFFIGQIDGVVRQWTMWNVSVVHANGEEASLTKSGTLYIPIPSDYNQDNVKGYIPDRNQGTIEVGTIENGYLVITNASLGQYAVTEAYSFDKTAESLETGKAYSVDFVVDHAVNDVPSMADGAFVKPGIVYVGEKSVKIYFDLKMVQDLGRLQKLWLSETDENNNETLNEAVYYDYLKGTDGEPLAETTYAGRTIYYPYYPMKASLELPKDKAEFSIKVRVPIMDGLSGEAGYVGKADPHARLRIDYSTAKELTETSDIPTEKSALQAEIQVAGQMKEEEFTSDSWKASGLSEAIDDSQKAVKSDDSAAIATSYKTLQAALNKLEYSAAVGEDKGLYEADCAIGDNALGTAKLSVTDDGTAKVYVPGTGMKSLQYYNIYTRQYVQAEETDAVDGSKQFVITFDPIKAYSSPATAIYQKVAVKYTDENDTEQNGWLTLGEIKESAEADKTELNRVIESAKNALQQGNDRSEEDRSTLQKAIEAAQEAADNNEASQSDVTSAKEALEKALEEFQKGSSETLDPANLPDGEYTVTGTMQQPDGSRSMSDGAIDHTVKISVKDGTYTVQMQFHPLTNSGLKGYLSNLKYYQTGYTKNTYGKPEGTLAETTVKDYWEESDGSRVKDDFGTNYPKDIEFELIPEAKTDGYVPLQVFVPLMESISTGSGTQDVFLKLDWTTLASTKSEPDPTPTPTPSPEPTPTPTPSPEPDPTPAPSPNPTPSDDDNNKKNNTKSAASKFTDVSKDAFYYDALNWAVEKGVTAGTTATTFSPNAPTTRAQMVQFLYKMAGSPAVSGTMPFADVKEGSYYYKAVLWAVQNGITAGTTATTFSPNEKCSRAQMAQFLYKFKGKNAKVSGTMPFTDVAEEKYYYNAVLWAYQNKVTSGLTDTTFGPNADCTRGEMVQFLYNIKDL